MPIWINLLIVSAGALIMLASIVKGVTFKPLIQSTDYRKAWNIRLILMSIFFVGYLSVLFLIYMSQLGIIVHLVSFIFLGGAIFVHMTVGVAMDMSGDLISSHKEMESRVEKRTAELKDANLKLKKNSEAKSRFLANMSHEIRTPLGGILGISELALDETTTDTKRKELIGIINDCSQNLLVIVNDILDFSKIEAGKLELENRSFELKKLIDSCLYLFDSRASEKGVNLESDIAKSVPAAITGDDTRIRQILVNLISNAIKFTEKGTVKVAVTSTNREDSGLYIRFSVADNGIGISEDAVAKLFQSFSQVDASTTRKYGGTGLGLSICKGLAESMGGKIWVDSVPGKGSVFSFTIQSAEVCIIPEKKASDNQKKHNIKVLLVEDNPVNQTIGVNYLEKLGCQVEVANNGAEAIEAVTNKQFEICFMDCQMPVVDGYEATRRICRDIPESNRPYIVAMTANAMEGDKEKCLEAGMDMYLTKPVRKAALTGVLNQFRSGTKG